MTRARIRVTNPIAREWTLTCTLHVGAETYTRRFPTNGGPLTFDVTAPTGASVRARMYERHPAEGEGWVSPMLAPGWSRPVRL